MAPVHDNLTELVGTTPLVHLGRLIPEGRVLGKLESLNPGGSVKDRAALAMIRAAEADGRLAPGGTILEATSGNTGIALAWIGTAAGYRVVLVIPEDQSLERRALVRALGAELVLTPAADGMAGANRRAGEILAATPGAWLVGQGGNPANLEAHYRTTGPEIWADTEGEVDIFVGTTGTGGTVTGAGRYLKEQKPDLQVVAVEPAEAPVYNGGDWQPHRIQGIIGGASVPPITDLELFDEVIDIPEEEALEVAREAMRTEGLIAGISAGAALAAARRLAARPENAGKTIVAVLPDTGERYISTDLFAPFREADETN